MLENFKVGGLKQYGLDYASLRAINPRLIYCSITGFGQTGPYAQRAGYDFLIQAMSGLMSITGRADGEPGGGPQKVGVALTDILTGLYATVGDPGRARAPRPHRRGPAHRPGAARRADRHASPTRPAQLPRSAARCRARMGNAHPNIVPYQDFPTADGDMILAIGNDGQFARFCEVAGQAEWAARRALRHQRAAREAPRRADPAAAPGDA